MSEQYVPTTDEVREQVESTADTRERAREYGQAFDRYLAQHDREVKAEALREYADLVEEIANLGANNTGLRTPHHLAEYTRNYAARIAEGKQP